ncbi:hypothetical protein PM10SUCC1_06090 [Propionigenium maris DSM 9537]|uniref:Uncharacterized protein n=1 Tax=Propionigenium maris DSM 9537 TaxID=1123000 RepID=A0A9W6GJM1_9FUSO|nr:hypothetical protein PM10SUCC1_06090 [Propionigenium maris DSM 9537]
MLRKVLNLKKLCEVIGAPIGYKDATSRCFLFEFSVYLWDERWLNIDFLQAKLEKEGDAYEDK